MSIYARVILGMFGLMISPIIYNLAAWLLTGMDTNFWTEETGKGAVLWLLLITIPAGLIGIALTLLVGLIQKIRNKRKTD